MIEKMNYMIKNNITKKNQMIKTLNIKNNNKKNFKMLTFNKVKIYNNLTKKKKN